MWGEPGHGKAIPYDSLASPADLRAYLASHGYGYIIVNYSAAPLLPPAPGQPPRSWSEKVKALVDTLPGAVYRIQPSGEPDLVLYRL
jgi:hypothetical protein